MLRSVIDKEALERSMNKSMDKEYDGFDHIRSNMDSVAKAVSLGKDIVGTAADVYSDIQQAADSIKKATSSSARTSSEAGISIDSSSKRARIDNVVQETPCGFSTLSAPSTLRGVGIQNTAAVGNKTSPPVQLKLGKQLGPLPSIDNFLSLFNQTGSISGSFGGRLLCGQDERVRIFHCFRHNLHAQPTEQHPQNGITDGVPYPSTAKILNTRGNINIFSQTIPKSPIETVVNGGVYFSPYNKPDLEDVSFNLNKFKLGPVTTVNGLADDNNHGTSTVSMPSYVTNPAFTETFAPTKIALLNDVEVMKGSIGAGEHRSNSAIYQNNSRAAAYASASSYTSAPYKYDAVLRQGTVDYLFMNKGQGPISVEVVVYRVKQNGTQGVPSKFADLDLTEQLEKVISKGNYNKYLGGFGTDNLGPATGVSGSRSETSWYTEPDIPYLPSCRQIDQAALAYKEVQRIKVCLTSGERRPFQLKLGGEKYDPTSLVRRIAVGADQPDKVPIFDKYSYIVALVVNGMIQSRQLNLDSDPDTLRVVGDCYGNADFQFTATYTEHVGAMSYKRCSAKHLFTEGNSPSMHHTLTVWNTSQAGQNAQIASTPVVLVDQRSTTRTGTEANGGQSQIFT